MSDVNKEETEQIELLLRLLKTFNVRNGIRMGFIDGELWFFKNDHSIDEHGNLKGVRVKLKELVK